MDASDLVYDKLNAVILKPFQKRAPEVSAQFLRWFLENIFRLDRQDADDACVDAKQDKGIDGLYVNDVTETVHLFQVKTRQKENATLGDTELKEFYGSLNQFRTKESIEAILASDANEYLKSTMRRNKIIEKVESGYRIEGIFCTNINRNTDAIDYLKNCPDDILLYDADKIASEFVEFSANEGIKGEFIFNVSDTEVIKYQTSDSTSARIFLAEALQLTHLEGIQDGKLFEKNVRLSLGNTKINKSLIASIKSKEEHKNFPLYHNGITVVCEEFTEENGDILAIKNYVVVNGAQSLSSLYATKSKITSDLRILVRAIAVKGDSELSDKITTNSNNQNAIKPRDMRSNHGIQQRLKAEVENIGAGVAYEVKRGEKLDGKILENEDAGLILLAMDLGEPWSCHQKYKVMDDSHSKIFGRPDVTGWKIVGLHELFLTLDEALNEFDDQAFGQYTLTRYFLSHAVSEIIRDSKRGSLAFRSLRQIIEQGQLAELCQVFSDIAKTTVNDLNAEVAELAEAESFDYKSDLKSPNWGKSMTAKLKASYRKDVTRKKAEPVDFLLKNLNI